MRILHIEDCESISVLIQQIYQDSITIECITSLAEAKKRLEDGGIDLLLVDLNLDDSSGLDTIKELEQYNLPIVVLSGVRTPNIVDNAFEMGVDDYIDKQQLPKVDLVHRLRNAVERHSRIRKMAGKKLSFGNLDAIKPYISSYHKDIKYNVLR